MFEVDTMEGSIAEVLGGRSPPSNGDRGALHLELKVADTVSDSTWEEGGVAGMLLHRIAQVADDLDRGTIVEPQLIAEGIDLWEKYLHRTLFERLSELADPPWTPCAGATREAREQHERAPQRMMRLRALLGAYAAGLPNARAGLVFGLRSELRVDRAWICFEGKHPYSCSPVALYPIVSDRLLPALVRSRRKTNGLENRVLVYLTRSVFPDRAALRYEATHPLQSLGPAA